MRVLLIGESLHRGSVDHSAWRREVGMRGAVFVMGKELVKHCGAERAGALEYRHIYNLTRK